MLSNLRLAADVTCGMALLPLERASARSLALRTEAAGFDAIWTGDHISFPSPILESINTLSFFAGVTERVRLGTAIFLLPLRHPTVTAKMTASLDVLSGGRLTFGVGVGGEFPAEFAACGIPVEQRGKRTDLAIPLIRRLWTEDGVSNSDGIFDFGAVTIDPKPVQKNGPPILVGGRKAAALRRAGQFGDGYISNMCTPEQFARNLAEIDVQAGRFGRHEVDFQTTCFVFAFPDSSYERAAERAGDALTRMYNTPFHDVVRKYTLLGDAPRMAARLAEFVAAGARHFIFSVREDEAGFIDFYEHALAPELARLRV